MDEKLIVAILLVGNLLLGFIIYRLILMLRENTPRDHAKRRMKSDIKNTTLTLDHKINDGSVDISWERTNTPDVHVLAYWHKGKLPETLEEAEITGQCFLDTPAPKGTYPNTTVEPGATIFYSFHLRLEREIPYEWEWWNLIATSHDTQHVECGGYRRLSVSMPKKIKGQPKTHRERQKENFWADVEQMEWTVAELPHLIHRKAKLKKQIDDMPDMPKEEKAAYKKKLDGYFEKKIEDLSTMS